MAGASISVYEFDSLVRGHCELYGFQARIQVYQHLSDWSRLLFSLTTFPATLKTHFTAIKMPCCKSHE